MIYNETLNTIQLNNYKIVCDSCTLHIALLVVFLLISIVISGAFIYFYWYSEKNITNLYY